MKEALAEHAQDPGCDGGDKISVGTIVAIDQQGHVSVDFAGNTGGPVPAYYTNSLKSQLESHMTELVGQKVLLAFDEDELELPIIVDTLHSKIKSSSAALEVDSDTLDEIKIDGRRISLEGMEQITLKCGKSSIHMTKAGKIIIRGTYLLNRSSGVNRIKGGAVQIN